MRSLFLRQYLRNLRTVGAVAPSSKYLARRMVSSVDFDKAKVIVEYGPGTGAITRELVNRLRPETKLLVIETNHAFYEHLHKQYSNHISIEIIHDSAANTAGILKARKLPNPDYIVSGLPFAALPANVSREILEAAVRLLGHSGVFVTFQYTLLKRELFESYFDTLRITREVRNIPPAYVFCCDNR